MKYLSFIIVLLLVIECNYSQTFENSVSGRVNSAKTGEPLPFVNIFISNSTWGTTSDMNGFYKLTSIRPGSYDLVFSMIGFETEIQNVQLMDTSNISINIKLREKVYETDEVEISSKRPVEWFEDLEIFKEKFFGNYSVQLDCEIENQFYLEFDHPSKDVMIARCQVPLTVNNYSLGYFIKCEIVKFEYNFFTKKLDTYYILYFTDLLQKKTGNEKYIKNLRQKVYKGSIYYFLRELISGNINDFQIFNTASNRSSSRLPGLQITNANEILQNNNFEENYRLQFENYLHILRYEEYYLVGESWIALNYPFVTIDKFGYPLEELAFTLYGNWARRGISTQMPIDFKFDDKVSSEEGN